MNRRSFIGSIVAAASVSAGGPLIGTMSKAAPVITITHDKCVTVNADGATVEEVYKFLMNEWRIL